MSGSSWYLPVFTFVLDYYVHEANSVSQPYLLRARVTVYSNILGTLNEIQSHISSQYLAEKPWFNNTFVTLTKPWVFSFPAVNVAQQESIKTKKRFGSVNIGKAMIVQHPVCIFKDSSVDFIFFYQLHPKRKRANVIIYRNSWPPIPPGFPLLSSQYLTFLWPGNVFQSFIWVTEL